MSVASTSLTSLEMAKTFLRVSDSNLQVDAFSIYNNSSDATASTIEVTASSVVLIVTGGANAGTSTLDITAAAYDTLGELTTAITALDKGWQVTRLSNSSSTSIDLALLSSTGCFNFANIQYLTMTNNYLLERLIDNASVIIENFCDRIFVSATYTNERYDGDDTSRLILYQRPVTQVKKLGTQIESAIRITYTDTANAKTTAYFRVYDNTNLDLHVDTDSAIEVDFATYTTITAVSDQINSQSGWTASIQGGFGNYKSTELLDYEYGYCLDEIQYAVIATQFVGDFVLYPERGIVELNRRWLPTGYNNITVTYVAGYASTAIPKALEDVTLSLVSWKYKKLGKDTSIKSEKLGDYSYTNFDMTDALSEGQMEQLYTYRNIDIR